MHLSEFLPVIVWIVVVFGTPQAIKKLARHYGFRHARWLEVALPVLPMVVGAATAAAWPLATGVHLLMSGDEVSLGYAALLGLVGGAFASVGYKLAVEAAPESWRPILSQVGDAGEGQ